jgi:hypothetical protein
MKKLFISIISVALVFTITISAVAISNYSNSTEERINIQSTTVNNCYNIAESVITKYYIAQQTSTKVDFKENFYYSALNDYLQSRLSNSYYLVETTVPSEIKNILIAESIDVECQLLDCKFYENTIELNVGVDLSVKYPQMNTYSYFMNTVDFLFIKDNNTYKIVDMLFEDEISNEELTLDSNRWNLNTNLTFVQEKTQQTKQKNEKFKQNISNINNYIVAINDTSLDTTINDAPDASSTRTIGTFNKSNMVTYAKNTAPLRTSSDNKLYKSNGSSARGSSEAPYYYDFNSFAGSYDCTNFISHCLLAGGAKMNKNGNPSTGWYFNNVNTPSATSRSYTWSGVTQFGNMLISNTGNGPRGNQVDYYSSSLELGDIIQFQYSDYSAGSYGHSAIITKDFYGDNLPSAVGPIKNCGITSRSFTDGGPVDQNFYRKILNLDGGNEVVGYRCIHLTNYAY